MGELPGGKADDSTWAGEQWMNAIDARRFGQEMAGENKRKSECGCAVIRGDQTDREDRASSVSVVRRKCRKDSTPAVQQS